MTWTQPQQPGMSLTVWYAERLRFPMKQVLQFNEKQKHTMWLEKIVLTEQPAELFEAPADYEREKTRDEIEAALPLLKGQCTCKATPAGRRVGEGGELIVSLTGQTKATVRAENWLKGETIVECRPFCKGTQRENIGVDPWKIQGKGMKHDRDFNGDGKMFGDTFLVDQVKVKVVTR